MKFHNIIFLVFFVLIVGLLIYIHFDIFTNCYNKYFVKRQVIIEEDIIKGCCNKDLSDTAICLKNNIIEIYHYNESNIGVSLTFEELKEQGGVCEHYSILYINSARALGFVADYVVIDIKNETYHMVAVISDETGYCILDQEFLLACVELE